MAATKVQPYKRERADPSVLWEGSARRIVIASSAALVLVGTFGCGQKELSERPPEGGATAPTITTRTSTIGASIFVPFAHLTKIVNETVQPSYSTEGTGQPICAEAQIGTYKDRKCVDPKYTLTIERTGAVVLGAPDSKSISVTVPLRFSGKGGARGDIARLLKLDEKNFAGAMRLNVRIEPKLGADWCPSLTTIFDYSWIDTPQVEIVSGVWVDVSGQAREQIDKQLAVLQNKLTSAMSCDLVRKPLSDAYTTRSMPVPLPSSGTVHVNVTPASIGFSGFIFSPKGIEAAASVKAKVEVEDTPIKDVPIALPALQRIEATLPRIELAVPIRVSYATLIAAARNALAGKTFSAATPAGEASILVQDFEAYPSGNRLVVGLSIVAKLPGKFLDTTGKVYLLAAPKVVSDSVVRFEDIDFARVLDNDFWNLASAVLQGPIRKALTAAAEIDLEPQIAGTRKALEEALAGPEVTKLGRVTANDIRMGVGAIAVTNDELAAELVFSALVQAFLGTPDDAASPMVDAQFCTSVTYRLAAAKRGFSDGVKLDEIMQVEAMPEGPAKEQMRSRMRENEANRRKVIDALILEGTRLGCSGLDAKV